jgi:hypothetical protein
MGVSVTQKDNHTIVTPTNNSFPHYKLENHPSIPLLDSGQKKKDFGSQKAQLGHFYHSCAQKSLGERKLTLLGLITSIAA